MLPNGFPVWFLHSWNGTFADTIPTCLTLLLSKSPLPNKGRLVGCLIKGFFGTVWLDLASMSMTHSTKIKTAAGHRCLRLAVTALYDLTSTIWKGQNDVLHCNKAADDQLITNAIDADIKTQYECPELLCHDDLHFIERRSL